jgi:uncharacterized membrane protein YczE
MKRLAARLARLVFGLFLYAVGIVITLNARIGFAPWDVFHAGLAETIGISFGLASIVTGVAIVAVAAMLGERIGIGTILNMLLIGVFLDALLGIEGLPVAANFAYGALMMAGGMFIIAIATYFYIGSGFGAGPRDSLMVAITRKTGFPVGIVRAAIELLAVLVGWGLGGMLGLGTVASALAMGLCIQLVFRLFRFDPTAIRHESIRATLGGRGSA